MADIATVPQATEASGPIDTSVVSTQNEPNQSDAASAIATESTAEASEQGAVPPKDPPKPVFAWGKPSTGSSDSSNDASKSIKSTSKAKSLMDIMQEEQEISKAKQAQKEEDEFMKQAIQQSLAMQQREEDDLALALRLSQLDAGVVDVTVDEGVTNTSRSDDECNLNLKQAPGSKAASQVASAQASMPETVSSTAAAAASVSHLPSTEATGLSEEELASIQLAIQQAEDEDMQKSLQLAMQFEMENENLRKQEAVKQRQHNQGNVRVISREEYLLEQKGLLLKKDHGDEGEYYRQEATAGGFRINAQQHASSSSQAWTRLDGFVVGPNDEIRTKHDPELQGQANAHRLHLDQLDEYDHFETGGSKMRVGNKAYNSFQQTMKKKTVKGVASHGQGRANTDTEKTKEGALDSRVRLLIGKTINQDWIDEFHGCVKEGKEALVYHATSGTTSDVEMGVGQMDETGLATVGDFEHYDVAVKVFKRIQEFRNRGQYVQGDPRYASQDFSHSSGRVQLELWAEKEYRNLIRAYRVGIPVPQPLLQRENVLFLRFLGQDGWPCPQLREVKLKKKSHKWTALYQQTMEAIQTLYLEARLVHGDLSEYNLLVCPSHLMLRKKAEPKKEEGTDDGEKKHDGKIEDEDVTEEELDQKMPALSSKEVTFAKKEYDPNALQIALIDFGQAVDTRHPEATELLERDLLRVKQFFDKMGIATLSAEAAMKYVTTKGTPLTI